MKYQYCEHVLMRAIIEQHGTQTYYHTGPKSLEGRQEILLLEMDNEGWELVSVLVGGPGPYSRSYIFRKPW